jgi:hypothetical protein
MSERRDADQRFEEELRRATRALVTEELPRGVLDPAVGASFGLGAAIDGEVRPRRSLPGLAGMAAAVVVVLLATVVAFGPGLPGGTGPSPERSPTIGPSPTASPAPTAISLRPTGAIRVDMARLEYTCSEGKPLSSIGPGPNPVTRESAVCVAPEDIGPFMAAVIVGETAGGWVVEVHTKADIVGEDSPAARAAVAAALAKAAAIAVGFPGTGNQVGDWVVATLPTLERSTGDTVELGGISVKAVRNETGGYLVIVHAG